MNKGNKSSFWLTFSMPGIAGLVFGASTIIVPIQAQTLPSNATSTPSAAPSTLSWIEQSNPLIGWIAAIVAGLSSIVTSRNLVERKNQHIVELDREIKELEKDKEFLYGVIVELGKRSEEMKQIVDQLNEHPQIATSTIYKELRQKTNGHCNEIAKIPRTINTHREAKKWLTQKRVQDLLFRAALTKTLEIYSKEVGSPTKSQRNEIRQDIKNCIELLFDLLSEGIDVRKTKINTSQIISSQQAIESCVKALKYINEEELPRYVSKGEVSQEAMKEVGKYLEFLILRLSS